ncbi:hypothetical protein QE422_000565 [Chryseobacterium sp. SORGH_AS 447]|uniref:XAC2610-related protein n=1 Tax=Chryseobacterium sp. SORGH_AS_0447 TaxID=3041769 RepID=UPI0027854D5C|nr:hypothetical protein [Chryseobacterium sp. SORGH_AS_0447]MDQ1160197.1 hypothetical protein [Chryseobacterium sp. SORGH_AS_0447]
MKKLIFYLLIVGLMLSCNKKNELKENSNDTKIVNQANEHITERDSINGNEYVYYFKKEKNNSSKVEYKRLDSLIILNRGEKYVLNLIDKNISTGVIEGGVYSNLDYNFDGVNDIMLYPHITNPSVYNKNYVADFFIFNKETQKYENKAELDTIPNLDVCKKNKYLISNDGVFLRKYIWKENSLKLIETIKQTELETGNHKFHCE